MENHARTILDAAESWNWTQKSRLMVSETSMSRFKAIAPKLLLHFIAESVSLGGSLLDQFWEVVGLCDPRLKENVFRLTQSDFISRERSVQLLFEGIDRETVAYDQVFQFAAEIFIHLGVGSELLNPGGRRSEAGTPLSVSEEMELSIEKLLQISEEMDIGKRKQSALKTLALERDDSQCVITLRRFENPRLPALPQARRRLITPKLTHIIPNSIYNKPDTLKVLGMFAGRHAMELVRSKLNTISNVMNLESNAHNDYHRLRWGIEAQEVNGQIKYTYRNIPSTALSGAFCELDDGDQIMFGDKVGLPGPDPLLCNIQLAVARALNMSGAAELLEQLNDEADDSDFPHNFLASDTFADILSAKLLISGLAHTV